MERWVLSMAKPLDRNPTQERWPLWIEEAARALQSNLTVSENLAQCWVEVEVTEGAAIRDIPLPLLRGRPAHGVTVEKATVATGSLSGAPGVEWEQVLVKGAHGLRITQAHGLAPGTTATLRLLVKAE